MVPARATKRSCICSEVEAWGSHSDGIDEGLWVNFYFGDDLEFWVKDEN